LAVDDREIIQELDRISMRFVKRLSALVFKRKIVFCLIRKFTPALDPKDAIKVEKNIERGYVLHHTAAVVFIVGDSRAHAVQHDPVCTGEGIGDCLWGGGKVMLDRNRTQGNGCVWKSMSIFWKLSVWDTRM
jgi:hypothetical protein